MHISAIEGTGSLPSLYHGLKSPTLSPAEQRLLNLEKEGKPIKEIAHEMHLSAREVERRLIRIQGRAGGDRTALSTRLSREK